MLLLHPCDPLPLESPSFHSPFSSSPSLSGFLRRFSASSLSPSLRFRHAPFFRRSLLPARRSKVDAHPIISQRTILASLSTFPSPCALEGPLIQEGPSCVFVGPVETAEKDRLEALYQQARDSYYSGNPLILDDMFDKVEVRLRWYGSKLVLKYPRCSLKRLSVYADAEVDDSQVMALASIWMIFLVIGLVVALGPPACAFSEVCEDAFYSRVYHHHATMASEVGLALNTSATIALGLAIGIPVTTAAFQALKGLWRGDLVALKGACPSCGEEVYAFVRADDSLDTRHKTECHVCEQPLVFHAKVQPSKTPLGRPWAYGRVYLLRRAKDLCPP